MYNFNRYSSLKIVFMFKIHTKKTRKVTIASLDIKKNEPGWILVPLINHRINSVIIL